jgi:hypothetical protein
MGKGLPSHHFLEGGEKAAGGAILKSILRGVILITLKRKQVK